MKIATAGRLLAAVLTLTSLPAGAASRRERPVVVSQQDPGDDAGDPSGLVVRIGRLEEQIRSLTGELEQVQFQNRKLEESLRKLQGDVDFRLQDLEHGTGAGAPARPVAPPAKRTEAGPDAAPSSPVATSDTGSTATPSAVPRAPDAKRRGNDAFDPDLDPAAPGAPRPLGSTSPSAPLTTRPARQAAVDDNHAPLDLTRATPGAAASRDPDPSVPAVTAVSPAAVARDTGAVASLVPGGTREEYDADLGLYKQGQFDGAATGFAAFADKYPKDRLVPDAVYMAGESFAKLGRHREAAEQFLKVSTDYGKSSRAPDALLRLGVSLNALGAKEQACATYQEVTRRYPSASGDVKAGVDREMKRARCTGNG